MMTPKGRFAQLLARGIERTGLALPEIARQTDHSYEQFRKIYLGRSSPSPLLLKEICRILGIDVAAAQEAAQADRLARKYPGAQLTLGHDPRLGELTAVAAVLNDADLSALVAVAQALAKARSAA